MTTIDDLAATMKTNRHGRAALGIAAEHLRRAYEVVDQIRPSPWDFQLEDIGNSEVRRQGRDLLDRSNAYAQGLYALLRDNDEPLREDVRPKIAVALEQAESNLRLIESVKADLVQPFIEDMEALIDAIGTATTESVRWIAEKAKTVVGLVVPQWVWWAVGGALIVAGGVAAWRLSAQ